MDAWARSEVPSIYIKRLFKHAKVMDPQKLTDAKDSFLVKCLDIAMYMDEALKYLLDESLFEEEQEDGTFEVYEYEDMHELYQEADKMVKVNADSTNLLIDEKSFEWLHDFDDTAGEQGFKLLYEVTHGVGSGRGKSGRHQSTHSFERCLCVARVH